jgi:hypothetical protein
MLEGEWRVGQNPVTRSSLGADPLDALLGGGDLGKRGHSLSHSTRPTAPKQTPLNRIPAQLDLPRPYWTTKNRRWAVIS